MKLAAIAIFAFLLLARNVATAQGFVYPVGNPLERPAYAFPNANGFAIVQDFANEDGHTGVDLADSTEGGEIRSIGPGTVSLRASTSESKGFGNVVLIRHDLPEGTYYSLYAHMQDGSVTVKSGDTVEAGIVIGKIDCSGSTTGKFPCLSNGKYGPHLHFAVKKADFLGCGYISSKCTSGDALDNYVDPLDFVQSHLGPTTVVLQPGPDTGKDIWTTSVYSYATCSGPGPGGGRYDSDLRVGGWGDLYYSLLQFDLTGLPQHAISAVLYLYCYSFNDGTATPMYLDYIKQSWWTWQTLGTGCDHDRLWWANKPQVMQWSTAALPAPVIGQWYPVDITDLYNAWQSGLYPNFGLQLRPVQASDTFNVFYSSRYTGDPTLRPKLVIQQ